MALKLHHLYFHLVEMVEVIKYNVSFICNSKVSTSSLMHFNIFKLFVLVFMVLSLFSFALTHNLSYLKLHHATVFGENALVELLNQHQTADRQS